VCERKGERGERQREIKRERMGEEGGGRKKKSNRAYKPKNKYGISHLPDSVPS